MEPKGVEIPSHPPDAPAEAAPSTIVSFPEGNKEVSDRQKAKNAVTEGVGFIKGKLNSGFFDAGDKTNAKKDAEKVLDQVGKNNLNSDGLKAFFNLMPVIGEKTDKVSKTAAENMRVKVGDRMLTLDEWRAELEAAQKPADGNPSDTKRLKELENGVFAYSFPKTSEENPESTSMPKEKSPEDILISHYRRSFERKIEAAKKQGVDPGEEDLKTLVMLRLAEEARGQAGVIFEDLALKNLKDEHGKQGLDNAIETLQKKLSTAIEDVCGLMDKAKAEEFRKAIEEGKLEDLIKEGKLLKTEGMSELLFGKDFTEEKLKEILRIDKKKKWKDPLLLALIILLIGPIEMGKEVVPLAK